MALRICQHFTSSSPAVKKYISWMALKPVVMIFGRALVASFCSQSHSHQCCRMLPTVSMNVPTPFPQTNDKLSHESSVCSAMHLEQPCLGFSDILKPTIVPHYGPLDKGLFRLALSGWPC